MHSLPWRSDVKLASTPAAEQMIWKKTTHPAPRVERYRYCEFANLRPNDPGCSVAQRALADSRDAAATRRGLPSPAKRTEFWWQHGAVCSQPLALPQLDHAREHSQYHENCMPQSSVVTFSQSRPPLGLPLPATLFAWPTSRRTVFGPSPKTPRKL